MLTLLSINWNPNPELFNLFGSLPIRYYGLLWVVGIALAYVIVHRQYHDRKIDEKTFEPLFFYCFFGILIGARLGHCLFYQQEAVFEDEIGELMLGIALVEMKHYAHIRDAIVALGGTLPKPYDSKNVNIGETPVEALTLAAHSEVATIGFYKSVKERIAASTPTADIARKLLTKLIADESLHLKLLTRQLKVMAGDDKKYDELMKKILD